MLIALHQIGTIMIGKYDHFQVGYRVPHHIKWVSREGIEAFPRDFSEVNINVSIDSVSDPFHGSTESVETEMSRVCCSRNRTRGERDIVMKQIIYMQAKRAQVSRYSSGLSCTARENWRVHCL